MLNVDLTNCDREPIHIPGKIQSHGFLIAVDDSFNIAWCSENISDFLPASASQLLEKSIGDIDTFINKTDTPGFIIQLINLWTTNKGFEPNNPYSLEISGASFNLIISMLEDVYLLEFEPQVSDLSSDLQRMIGSSLSEMLADADMSHLLHKGAVQISKIIGYDRVMIYKFHEDGHGEVVAEVKNEGLEALMGLQYPASDIPKQARELYKLNLTRLISDVNESTSDILTYKDPLVSVLDLTYSALRAVSPIHIQYLKNMGVASSFSISLIHHGELWGLVACHNYTPRFINYKERDAAKLIGQVLSSALSFRQQEKDQQKSNRLQLSVDSLAKNLLRNNAIENALFEHDVTLLDAVEATGAVLFFDNQIHSCGIVPNDEFLIELVNWLNDNAETHLFATDKLPLIFPEALPYKESACGILVCRLSKELKEYMIWFRPEIITTVLWAGNPDKPVEVNMNGVAHISPRKSFEAWAQTVEFTSESWKEEDLKSALQLKNEVAFAISKKATEIRLLNERIKAAYDELNTFSYTISHDLKNPLSSIKGYSQLLMRNSSLDDKAQNMVGRIHHGADKMEGMIHDVLHYSSVGQAKAEPAWIDMEELLNELKEELLVANSDNLLQIEIKDILRVFGDRTMIVQVFSNLLGNAVKYSKHSAVPLIQVSSEDIGAGIKYKITDNGIGIKPDEHEKIFDLFTRSEEVKGYEGSGVGLSIVKKIIEKHHGRIWVESNVGKGSTFYVSFNKHELLEELSLIQ